MNIETNSQIDVSNIKNNTKKNDNNKKVDEKSSFANELSSLSETKEKEDKEKIEKVEEKADNNTVKESKEEDKAIEETKDSSKENKKDSEKSDKKSDETIDDVLNGLKGTVEEIQKLNEKNPVNQKDDKLNLEIKDDIFNADKNDNHLNNKEDNNLINNDMNIQDKKDPTMTPQMNMNMNFNGDGKPFNDFLNAQNNEQLISTQQELAEESAILSTMNENIAIANRNNALAKENMLKKTDKLQENNSTENLKDINPFDTKVKTVSDSEGIKKVDKKSNITVETVVKYDNVVMNEADVDFFTKLVETGSADMTKDVQQAQKSSQVSKTLADMLAKSMKDNQPIRIDFDNNISVIIKVSKEGKISADFLPSSQVAEAYLKENLPLLKQRFDENNIEYDELNQRRQKQDENKNRKKGSKDE